MHRALNCYLQMMLEFERLSTVGALEPSEHLVLLVADHVALQTVHIGKHFPTYSTILRRKLVLKDIALHHFCIELTTGFWSERPRVEREVREGEEWVRGFDEEMKEEGQV